MSFSEPPKGMKQSCLDLNKKNTLVFEYQKKMLGSLMINPYPRKVLVIGLGGGSLAKALSHMYKDISLDIVEINPFVLEAAERYFFFQKTNKTRIFLEDAYDFVERESKNNPSYDLVILDAFDSQYIPRTLLSQRFFSNLKRMITADGVIAINSFTNSQYAKLEQQLLQDNFNHFYKMPGKNLVLLISKYKSKDELSSNGSKIEKQLALINLTTQDLISRFDLE
jgi:spermidine synthase